jgi:hypothetical protein
MRVAPAILRQVRAKRTNPAAGAVKRNSSGFQCALESHAEPAATSMSFGP